MENTIVTNGRVKSIVEKLESHKDVSKVLMLCLAGSHAYGTATPTSDTDIRGIIVARPGVIRAPFRTLREMGIEDEEDGKVYELNNFMELFCDMNPNIIELGFTDDQATLYKHPAWDYLKSFLPQLLNKNVAYRFGGYAMAQLKRIKGHNKHINNPMPEEKPTQLEFFRLVQSYLDVKVLKHEDFMRKLNNMQGVCTLVPFGADIYGVVPDHREDVGPMFNPDGSIRKLQYDEIPESVKKQPPLFIVKYLRQDHTVAKDKHHNYWQWVKNRNAARHELEEKFGYDCYLDSSTEFLTREGFKKYDEIGPDDKLGVVNPVTKALEFEYYTDRVKKAYTGSIYTLETQDNKAEVTGNHRMFIAERSRKKNTIGEFSFAPLERLKSEFCQLRLAQAEETGDHPYIDDDLIVLTGAYVSEGSLIKDDNGNLKGVSISQLEDGRMCKHLQPLVEKGKLKVYHHERKGRTENTYNMYGKSLAENFKMECGEYSKGKKLPGWIHELGKRQARLLLEVMISGDGSERPCSWIYHTSSRDLANMTQELALLSGYCSKLWDYEEKHGMFQVYISKDETPTDFVYSRQHLTKREVENESVVCFTVPSETLVTRNNGKLSFHGNTKHAMHLVRLLRMGQEILETGQVIVRRPDAEELLGIRNGTHSYEDIVEWASDKDKLIREVLYHESKLPKNSNKRLAEELILNVQDATWEK
ncbi:putative nucleotidyltransferase [Pectobacterium phage DU_PP_I]|nr:putative nucleotidyltransferase [Pectobacterium phage DU_PP_I]ATS93902.1 putative nucleotidyltransferase [Pectobacterium phage DU_PP_IV]